MKSFFVFLILSLLFLSCGYNFTVKKNLPYGIDSIFVEMIENNTEEAGLESQFTNEFIKLIIRKTPEKLVSKNNAEVILNGEIVSFYTENVLYGEEQECNMNTTRRIVSVVQFNLRTSNDKLIWSSGHIKGSQEYSFISNCIKVSNENKKKAIALLIEQISASAFQMLTENF